jgi:hypothetical protein
VRTELKYFSGSFFGMQTVLNLPRADPHLLRNHAVFFHMISHSEEENQMTGRSAGLERIPDESN